MAWFNLVPEAEPEKQPTRWGGRFKVLVYGDGSALLYKFDYPEVTGPNRYSILCHPVWIRVDKYQGESLAVSEADRLYQIYHDNKLIKTIE